MVLYTGSRWSMTWQWTSIHRAVFSINLCNFFFLDAVMNTNCAYWLLIGKKKTALKTAVASAAHGSRIIRIIPGFILSLRLRFAAMSDSFSVPAQLKFPLSPTIGPSYLLAKSHYSTWHQSWSWLPPSKNQSQLLVLPVLCTSPHFLVGSGNKEN